MKFLKALDLKILALIKEKMPGGTIPSVIASKIGYSRSVTNWHLQKLIGKGLLKKRKLSVLTYYFVTDTAELYLANPDAYDLRNTSNVKSREMPNLLKKDNDSLRLEIIKHYSPELKCQNCGYAIYEALQIDHINGGGRKEAKSYGSRYGYYRSIIERGFPPDYQILCSNCNILKERKPLVARAHIKAKATVGVTKEGAKPIIKVKTSKPRDQRFHAIQINAGLYRTSADRALDKLNECRAPFSYNKRMRQIDLVFKGMQLRITTRKVIAYPKEVVAPYDIPLDSIKKRATEQAGALLEDFLSSTGLRCLRDANQQLILELRYWENGYPQNEVAEASLRDKSRIIYSYNRQTGDASSWADSSLNPFKEFETNSATIDREMKDLMQSTEDGLIRPATDILETKRKVNKVEDVLIATLHNHSGFVEEVGKRESRLEDIVLQQGELLQIHSSLLADRLIKKKLEKHRAG